MRYFHLDSSNDYENNSRAQAEINDSKLKKPAKINLTGFEYITHCSFLISNYSTYQIQ